MNVIRNNEPLPDFKSAVITVGTFDGVHNGHKVIIASIVDKAKSINGESVIITFHPHPRHIIQPEQKLFQLNALDEKLELLEKLGVDHVVVVPFSREFSELSAEDYVHKFLISQFQPACIIIGYDHHFGKDRSGNIHLLEQLASEKNVEVQQISPQLIDNNAISSTRIRKAIESGKIAQAEELLGYCYRISGHVIKGDAIGRTLGYPTANISGIDHNKLVPGNGIYAVKVHLRDGMFNGMMSIGMRPTFNGKDKRIEVNIFNFNKDIYGETITVELMAFLRSEEKFNSTDELIAAMKADEKASKTLFQLNQ